MADISKIDQNFAVGETVNRDGLVFYDMEQEPFRIYGVQKENGMFRRLPEEVAKTVNDGVYALHANTAGGRVRFVTDSARFAIHAHIEQIPGFAHMPVTGYAGLDLYVKAEDEPEYYAFTFVPPAAIQEGYESERTLLDGHKKRLITINFPLYSSLTKLYIGLEEGAVLEKAPDYTYEVPFVTYGSSITQGGCASRAGNCYQHILTRKLDSNHINLGFSGSARAEDTIIDWIKQMEMSVFIMDYDHNAPTVEHLRATHEKLFQAVRKEQPELPIIIMNRPKHRLNQEEKERLEIIRTTYRHAKEAGDEKVYLIENSALTDQIGTDGTVDNCHPNDAGFANMAAAVLPVLRTALQAK